MNEAECLRLLLTTLKSYIYACRAYLKHPTEAGYHACNAGSALVAKTVHRIEQHHCYGRPLERQQNTDTDISDEIDTVKRMLAQREEIVRALRFLVNNSPTTLYNREVKFNPQAYEDAHREALELLRILDAQKGG